MRKQRGSTERGWRLELGFGERTKLKQMKME